MTTPELDSERLREAFRLRDGPAAPNEACPEPDRLWLAVRGELSPAEIRRVVDHTSRCPGCAEAWRLSRELAPEVPDAGGGAVVGHRDAPSGWRGRRGWPRAAMGRLAAWGESPRWRQAAMATAGALMAVIAVWLLQIRPPVSEFREAGDRSIQSLVADDTLPRSDCLLRWSSAVEGARYRLRVSTEDLRVLAVVEGLEEARYRVPERQLVDLPADARLLWQVEADLPDGGRVASKTFILRLE